MTKIICIDARLWGTRHTGIGRYVENLIDNLPKNRDFKVVLIVPPDLIHEPKLANFTKFSASSHPYSLVSQLEMFFLLLKIRPDLLHVPHFTIPVLWPGKTVITIHDLIKHISTGTSTTTHSPLLYKFKYWGYLVICKIAVNRSRHIFVPANYWKMELTKRYRIPDQKITVTYEGVDKLLFSGSKTEKNDFHLPDPYLIYTGNLYPHKNIPVLIQAIKHLRGSIKLVIVCARNVFTERLEKLITGMGVKSDVVFLGRVTDSQLVNLYANSKAFVFPSLIEGFGLPGLEAMSVGTPVIAAKASCLPEIYGDAALYFDPHNFRELADLITKIITHEKLRQKYISLGRAQVIKYSWPNMAKLTWQKYLDVLR